MPYLDVIVFRRGKFFMLDICANYCNGDIVECGFYVFFGVLLKFFNNMNTETE